MKAREDRFTWDLNNDIVIDPRPDEPPAAVEQPVDPRAPKYKRLLIKTIFAGDEALYDEFLTLYDAAVVAGSAIPYDVAMIEFRKKYSERPDGSWVKR